MLHVKKSWFGQLLLLSGIDINMHTVCLLSIKYRFIVVLSMVCFAEQFIQLESLF